MFMSVGRAVSGDALELFIACNGMERNESDRDFFSLWPIEQCIEECTRFDADCMPFADFLVSSHEYVFRRESADRSSVWIDSVTQVASSVEEFFQLVVGDRRRLSIGFR